MQRLRVLAGAFAAASLATGASSQASIASEAGAAGAPARMRAGAVYSYRGNPNVVESTAAAEGAHVALVASSPTTIAGSINGLDVVESLVKVNCQKGGAEVTPIVPRIVLKLSRGRYRFDAKLKGVGVNVFLTGVVQSPTRITGDVIIKNYYSTPCVGSHPYSASLAAGGLKLGGQWPTEAPPASSAP